MEPSAPPSSPIDRLGTVLSSAALVIGALMAATAAYTLGQMKLMYSDMGEEQIPMLIRWLMKIHEFYGLHLLIVGLFAFGVRLLVSTKDRLRANLYAGLVAVMLLALGGIFYLCGLVPLVKIISSMANAQ